MDFIEHLAMKYALAKFRVYLLEDRPFVVYTDHASLHTAVNSAHLSQRMANWLSFFAEYNFSVEYKPERLNVVADALSCRPDYIEFYHLQHAAFRESNFGCLKSFKLSCDGVTFLHMFQYNT